MSLFVDTEPRRLHLESYENKKVTETCVRQDTFGFEKFWKHPEKKLQKKRRQELTGEKVRTVFCLSANWNDRARRMLLKLFDVRFGMVATKRGAWWRMPCNFLRDHSHASQNRFWMGEVGQSIWRPPPTWMRIGRPVFRLRTFPGHVYH